MLELKFKTNDYQEFLHYLSDRLQVPLKDDRIVLPPLFGDGYMQLVELPNNLQALVSDVVYHTDVMYSRAKSEDSFCILHFNDVDIAGSIRFVKNGKQMEDRSEHRAGVAMTSSHNDFSFAVKTGTKARTINILLPDLWLRHNLQRFEELQSLSKYSVYGNTLTHPEPFDAQNRILFDEVFAADANHPMHKMIMKNRILLILEHFLSKLYRNMEKTEDHPPRKIKASDLSKLMEIESLLVRDFGKPPPTIVALAEGAGMSVSKLKTAFKRVYGTGIYEYYQKNRMQKARSLLLTGQYNVKEVGIQLGYTNLSNFSLAFKKEFGMLPSQV